ncbi:MAG: type II toxin-antitoxin system RelE/ParE family toxin [Bacteroidetes bacterium]|nr:MAG: type II toxin-antitoxin system RelE/ParE family toxin [Bacteroidota bacterium]
MIYSIEIDRSASKNLLKLPKQYQIKIVETIDLLQYNPFPVGSIKLKGTEFTYRIRVGVYRIIYDVHGNQLLIRIVSVGHRKEIYK